MKSITARFRKFYATKRGARLAFWLLVGIAIYDGMLLAFLERNSIVESYYSQAFNSSESAGTMTMVIQASDCSFFERDVNAENLDFQKEIDGVCYWKDAGWWKQLGETILGVLLAGTILSAVAQYARFTPDNYKKLYLKVVIGLSLYFQFFLFRYHSFEPWQTPLLLHGLYITVSIALIMLTLVIGYLLLTGRNNAVSTV